MGLTSFVCDGFRAAGADVDWANLDATDDSFLNSLDEGRHGWWWVSVPPLVESGTPQPRALMRILRLLRAAQRFNVYFVLAAPETSWIWDSSEARDFRRCYPGAALTTVDSCQYQGGPLRVKLRMRLLSSLPWVPCLASRCDCSHRHRDWRGKAHRTGPLTDLALGVAGGAAHAEWLSRGC